jgi:transmembrane sensor
MTKVVDFPNRRVVAEEAAAWLIRLDADTPPAPEELQALGEWLRRSPAHREEIEKLAALWGRMNVLTELAVPLGSTRRSSRRQRTLIAAAATVMLAAGIAWLAHWLVTDPLLSTNGLYATAIGQQSTATLADGSQVVLNTNSQIRVDYDDAYRQVHLIQGEALFTVAKNPARPFRVYAGTRRIEALGTAFSVYLDGVDVSVTVTEGRVSLASVEAPPSPAVQTSRRDTKVDHGRVMLLGTLDAGQVAVLPASAASAFTAAANAMETIEPLTPEELAKRLAWREGVLMFSGETLEHAVKELSRYTTLVVEIPDPMVRGMRVGGRFPVGETEAMLTALQANLNLRVTRLGHNRVILSAASEPVDGR